MQVAEASNRQLPSHMGFMISGGARCTQAAYLLNLRRPTEKGPHPAAIWHANVRDDGLQNVEQLHSTKTTISRNHR